MQSNDQNSSIRRFLSGPLQQESIRVPFISNLIWLTGTDRNDFNEEIGLVDSNILVSSEAFQESITKFDEKIKKVSDLLSNISNTMSEIDGVNETWRSDTSKSIHEEFSIIESNFEKINAELTVYSIFLKETLEEYNNEENKQEKAIEDYEEDLNIN